jgi:hypothetical protein
MPFTLNLVQIYIGLLFLLIFIQIGQHYWYNISEGMSCDDFFPAFLLYNSGKLNAFGWATLGDFESNRYEHPPTFVLGVTISTLHCSYTIA